MTRAPLRLAALGALATLAGCAPSESEVPPKYTMVIGLDVSGSFRASGQYDDAVGFAAYYLYGHLQGLDDLRVPSAVFVGAVGGGRPGETKSFHPIHDFAGRSVAEIDAQLRQWFPPEDRFTDFNVFFQRVADHVKRNGLVLTPLNVVVLTDGVPDVTRTRGDSSGFAGIDLTPLEYLSRSTTVRLLYPTPPVAVQWERQIERRRVRLWTLDGQVMAGWRRQLDSTAGPAEQPRLWTWVRDNVDFRVRSSIL